MNDLTTIMSLSAHQVFAFLITWCIFKCVFTIQNTVWSRIQYQRVAAQNTGKTGRINCASYWKYTHTHTPITKVYHAHFYLCEVWHNYRAQKILNSVKMRHCSKYNLFISLHSLQFFQWLVLLQCSGQSYGSSGGQTTVSEAAKELYR